MTSIGYQSEFIGPRQWETSALFQHSATELSEGQVELRDLIGRCQEGDSTAITTFVKRFEQAVFGLCLRMLRDRHEAEDVAQESFLRAIRNLDRWDPTRPILPWLQTIAANRCRTALGKRKRRPVTAKSMPETAIGVDQSDELVEEIDRALAKMPDRYREVVTMYYRGGLGCSEIAEVFGCAEGTVKTWLFRARKQLSEELADRGLSDAS